MACDLDFFLFIPIEPTGVGAGGGGGASSAEPEVVEFDDEETGIWPNEFRDFSTDDIEARFEVDGGGSGFLIFL